MALHGLLTDSMGGETVLLTDDQANSAAIREEFRKLEAASPDDVVVIAFSGHGSETHQIVTYDTDPYGLKGATISLTALGEWCARIQCRRRLIVLDCRFSGGMGAKALQVEVRERSPESVDAELTTRGFVKLRSPPGRFRTHTFRNSRIGPIQLLILLGLSGQQRRPFWSSAGGD